MKIDPKKKRQYTGRAALVAEAFPWAPPSTVYYLVDLIEAEELARLVDRRAANRTNASKPRKSSVTKAGLLEFKKQFNGEHPDAKRGWIKAACFKFGVTAKTVKDRMK